MTPETLKALKGSIQHWRNNATPGKEDGVVSELCDLCNAFYAKNGTCAGCPVYMKTKKHDCINSPYYDAKALWSRWRFLKSQPQSVEFYAAAQKELDFLISLLPEGETA